jgi:hypothetical protein
LTGSSCIMYVATSSDSERSEWKAGFTVLGRFRIQKSNEQETS